MMGIIAERPSALEATVSRCNPQISSRRVVPDIGLGPLAAGSVARAPNPTTSVGKCQYYPKGQYRLCQFSVRVSHGAPGVLDNSRPRVTACRRGSIADVVLP